MLRRLQIGFGCLVLFLTPFCGVGLVAAVLAARSALTGDWKSAGFAALFALTFGGVGFGMLAAAFSGKRRAAEIARLEDEHPRKPWLWRPEWVSGRIKCATRSSLIMTWAFALLWNLISAPAPFLAVNEAVRNGNHLALLALVFPLVGIGLMVWAIRLTIRHRKFGVSIFEMTHVPAPISRALLGVIHTNVVAWPDGGFRVKLACVKRVTSGSGRNRSTSERILFQEERTTTAAKGRFQARGAVIPVAFPLPADAQESDHGDPNDQIVWRLQVEGSVPGVDYSATFEVPVFRTAESATPLSPEEVAQLSPDGGASYRPPSDSRIYVTTNRRGTEIFFGAARNLGVAISLSLFTLLWTGIVVLLSHLQAPIIFPILFGLFDILLIFASISLWLGTARVVIDGRSVTITRGPLGVGPTRRLRVAEIESIKLKVGMQAGNTPYYDIKIVTKGAGRGVTAGTGIRDKREAEWLVTQMKETLGWDAA